MGEQSLFEPGQKAPNNGIYYEVGEDDFHMNINNPKQVELSKGDKFPELTNHNRKWRRKGTH
ncbi:hypothetical protein SY83_06785 [Paenibacillus swuensis]|uniref:YjzC family protein n=1 Tax=Paenibacillus swuensis TaxID=1178515 RepID=A0A172TGA2_9BACL|nr:YjzC family protein [Paenibacillus swuensis]ANE46040.1 hypothetical protein SY83_06785 [Paenibacillus swuensis]